MDILKLNVQSKIALSLYQSWQEDHGNSEPSDKGVSIQDEFSSVGKVAGDVQDQKSDLQDHDSTQKVKTHLDLGSQFAPLNQQFNFNNNLHTGTLLAWVH